jgi:Tfp pilus assembly protein PilX
MIISNTKSIGARPRTQRGVTLVVGLIMLLVLTLFAVSAIRLSSANLRTVGNMQARAEATSAAQTAIEQTMSDIGSFTAPVARNDVAVPVNGTDYIVDVDAPVCVLSEPVLGNSHDNTTLALQDTYWDVAATATDERTGASVRIHQGVRVRLDAAAACPP